MEFNTIRRYLWPKIERWHPPIFAYAEAKDVELAGVLEMPIPVARRAIAKSEHVYPNAAAALKYYKVDGKKVNERGSYAYRPNGRFSKYQTHYRLFPHEAGTAIFAHYELNPLTNPIDHYRGKGWNARKGRRIARKQLNLERDYSVDGITTYK